MKLFYKLNLFNITAPDQHSWVYLVWVRHGFDFHDPHVTRQDALKFWMSEQEVTEPGLIPWSNVVGYREILRNPSPGAPAEFTGPVFIREHFKSQEPEAFDKVMHLFSLKSKYTEDFENHRPWNQAKDPKREPSSKKKSKAQEKTKAKQR